MAVNTMRKGAILLVMALLLTMIVPAYAAQTRTVRVTPSISFSGSTATCKANIRGEKATDVITATVTLWRDGSYVRSWNATAMGALSFTGTAAAVSGSSYRLVVAYSINGETKPSHSISRTYS